MKGGGGQIDSPSPEKTTFKMPNLIMVEIYIIYIQLSTGAMTDREICWKDIQKIEYPQGEELFK